MKKGYAKKKKLKKKDVLSLAPLFFCCIGYCVYSIIEKRKIHKKKREGEGRWEEEESGDTFLGSPSRAGQSNERKRRGGEKREL